MQRTILIAEDEKLQRANLSRILHEKLGYHVLEAKNGEQALEILAAQSPDTISAVLVDLYMPALNGIETLKAINQQHPLLPVIIMTASNSIEDAVEAMKLGAVDYLSKPPSTEQLQHSLQQAIKISSLSREVSRLKRKEDGATIFQDIVGHDRGLAKVINIGQKAAKSDIPVLISGETGVGKELFSRAIHGESYRVGRPFVAVNCGAIPPQLIESILFGHEKGAFTGAIMKTHGKFREAEGGTIFLDEIGELPLDAQVKLLRVLQEKEIEPVGASKSVPVNVRIISATNKNLADEVNNGKFREDLFFRLNVLPIRIPSLHERTQDIPALIQHFIYHFSSTESLSFKLVSPEAMDMLSHYSWQGNIRELENTIHRALVLCDNDILDTKDFLSILPPLPTIKHPLSESLPPIPAGMLSLFHTDGRMKSIDEIEHDVIAFVMSYHQHNVTRAAKSLGMAKATFYRRLKPFGGKNIDKL